MIPSVYTIALLRRPQLRFPNMGKFEIILSPNSNGIMPYLPCTSSTTLLAGSTIKLCSCSCYVMLGHRYCGIASIGKKSPLIMVLWSSRTYYSKWCLRLFFNAARSRLLRCNAKYSPQSNLFGMAFKSMMAIYGFAVFVPSVAF